MYQLYQYHGKRERQKNYYDEKKQKKKERKNQQLNLSLNYANSHP